MELEISELIPFVAKEKGSKQALQVELVLFLVVLPADMPFRCVGKSRDGEASWPWLSARPRCASAGMDGELNTIR